jgi:hypothetical protein
MPVRLALACARPEIVAMHNERCFSSSLASFMMVTLLCFQKDGLAKAI